MNNRLALLFVIMFGAIAQMAQSALCQPEKKPQSPLLPIEGDCIYPMDFFWDRIQQSSIKALGPNVASYSWEAEEIGALEQDSLEKEWQKLFESADLLGESRIGERSLSASLKNFRLSYQMFLHSGKAKYVDLAERILCNSILSRINEAEADPQAQREALLLLSSVDRFVYAHKGSDIYLNMPMRQNAHIKNDSVDLILRSVSSCPWYNDIAITVGQTMDSLDFSAQDSVIDQFQRQIYQPKSQKDSCWATIRVRIPSWASSKDFLPYYIIKGDFRPFRVLINGFSCKYEIKEGYAVFRRKWGVGDNITIIMGQPIVRISPKDAPDSVALQRGPLLYKFMDTFDKGAYLRRDELISHHFSKADSAIVLSAMLQEEERDARFFALPAYKTKERLRSFVGFR